MTDALKRPEHGIYVAGCVIIDNCKHNGMNECNDVLRTVGWDAQQNVGAKNVKQKNQVNKAGNVEHLE